MDQLLVVVLNGLTLAALYFIVASGLTLIFGLMRIVNLAHGGLYLLGGYITWRLVEGLENYWLAVALTAVTIGVVGTAMYLVVIRPIEGHELRIVLATLGVAVVAGDQMLAYFGGMPTRIRLPGDLRVAVEIPVAGVSYPGFRLLVIGAAVLVGMGLWFFLTRTRLGLTVRAGIEDKEMVETTGVNVRRHFAGVFFIGSVLAGLSGALGGGVFALSPGVDMDFLLYSLVVIIVGGMGSVAGAALGALLVGLTSSLALFYVPSLAAILVFMLMVVMIIIRPQGILRGAEV